MTRVRVLAMIRAYHVPAVALCCVGVAAAFAPRVARAQRHVTVLSGMSMAQAGGTFSVRLRLPADSTLRNAAVSLEAFGDAPYQLETASSTADVNGTVTFNDVRVRAKRFVLAQPVRVPVRVSANGNVLDTTSVSVLVDAPSRYLLDVEDSNPDSIGLGVKQELRAFVTADLGGRTIVPVSGASAELRLPNGVLAGAVSDSTGVARFRDLVVHGAPGEVDLSFSIAGALVPIRVVKRVALVAGPATKVELTATTSREYRVGHAFGVWARVTDVAGNALRQDTVDLTTAGGGAYLRAGESERSASTLHLIPTGTGSAKLAAVRYLGPTGIVRLIGSIEDVADTVELVVSHGDPHRIRILQQPSTSIVADSAFELVPIVRVEDAAGNAVPNVTVTMRLCQPKHPNDPCKDTSPTASALLTAGLVAGGTPSSVDALGFIRGQTSRVSDTLGVVRFDSLAVVGPPGCYTLEFRRFDMSDNAKGEFSNPMCYDVDRAYNRNFVIISAIRSIAGSVTPPDEFFDIRFRFRFGREWHGMVHSDLSVVRRSIEDVDSVRSTTKRLVDAALLLNWTDDKYMQIRDALSGTPERFLFIGAQLRLFATVPYIGAHVGSVELARSLFHGSSLSFGLVTPLQRMPVRVENEPFRPTPANIVIDAFLRSSGVDFLKYLNIRGGVLIPMTKGQRPASRIVLAVPVGGLISF
jgi:hypothetical protein